MKKKLLLSLIVAAIFTCLFAIAVSAASQSYTTFDVTLADGTVKTVYTPGTDQWQGRVYLTATLYAEPPLDSEGTYETVDWANVKVLDFSNSMIYLYSNNDWKEMAYGTNNGGMMYIMKNGATSALMSSVEKVITGKATHVAGGAFNGMANLKEIVISKNVKELQFNCLDNNKSLTTVTFEEGCQITTIAQQAFLGCTALETIDLPNTVTSMGTKVFNGCTSLENVTWPTGMTTIPNFTFYGCTSLSEFTIPDNITTLGDSSFQGCSALKNINISANSQISNKWISIFRGCTNLESIFIPPLVTEIRYDNFWDCNSLKQITFSEGLESISGGNNFTSCSSLEKIVFPNSMTTLAAGNLTNCTSLKEIRFGNSLTKLSDGILAYLHALERVYIPASVESIGDHILGYSNPADSADNVTLIFTGTMEQAAALQLALKTYTEENAPDHIPNSSKFYNAELVSAKEYDADTTAPSGYHLVYGYSACKAFYNNAHKYGAEQEKFLGDAYTTDYVVASTCQRCLENVIKETICGPLFIDLGYAKADDGSAFSYDIKIYKSNIAIYEETTGKTLNYGFIVGAYSEGDTGDIVNLDGTSVIDKSVITDFSEVKYDKLDKYCLKMTGLNEAQYEVLIYCNAYVNNGETVSYMGAVTEESKALAVSYQTLPVKNDEE